jgi:hypothetical protein
MVQYNSRDSLKDFENVLEFPTKIREKKTHQFISEWIPIESKKLEVSNYHSLVDIKTSFSPHQTP